MNFFRIEKYQAGQETAIYQLIRKVYDEFVAKDYSNEGNQFFYDWIAPSKIAKRQLNIVNLWVARREDALIGMIEIRDNRFLSLLFVDKAFQGQGIAKQLFSEALKEVLQRDATLDKFYVHASPFSIPIYRKMGFKETAGFCEENGIKYVPMEMNIPKT